MQRRREERNQDETEHRKYIEGEAKDFIPGACELNLVNKPDWSSSSVPLVAEYHLKIPGWVAGAGHRAMFPVGLFTATEKHVFDHTQRTHPIYFEFPSEKVDDIRIILPVGWQVASVPAGLSVDAKAVRYVLKAEDVGGSVHLTRNLGMNLILIEPQLYPVLRDFFQVVRTGDEEQIVLQPLAASGAK